MRNEFLNWLNPTWNRETTIDDEGDEVFLDVWVQGAWIGWLSGRASLVIELPSWSNYDTTKQVLYEVNERLQDAGITVREE
jgi:hypothetical protein